MRKLFTVILIAASFGLRADAQASAAAQPSPAEAIAPMAWLVGGTWVGEEKGAGGSVVKVMLNTRWSETRNAILFDVAFESGGKRTAQYDGMFIWHPARKKITLWQINRKNEVAEGEVTANGDVIDQTVSIDHMDGGKHYLKVRYRLLDKGTFHFKGYFRLREDAPWQDAVEVTYRRQP